jgi:hypothetical protein
MDDGRVRVATEDDLEAIVALTAAKRRRLAAWSSMWWPPADGADELHRAWLDYLIGGGAPVVRVLVDDGLVVGCAVSVPQGSQWFIDDVALAEDEPEAPWGVELLSAVEERPALTCIPTLDLDGLVAAEQAALEAASSYWVRATEAGDLDGARPVRSAAGVGPRHSFGGPFDPADDASLAVAVAGGVVLGSPPTAAPPVYGTGGTVAVIDRVLGDDRAPLLRAGLAAAHARGDVLACVVCDVADVALEDALRSEGFTRTVEVYCWP